MGANDPRNTILLDYGELADEETKVGEVCPACDGGTTEEGSLSITRRGGFLLYNCHRASCDFSGRIQVAGSSRWSASDSAKEKRRANIPVVPLSRATTGFLAVKFGIPRESLELAELGWTGEGRDTYSRRISFPIFGPDLKQRGVSYRSYEGANPKSLIFLSNPDATALAWYKFLRKSDTLILVEDQVSAIKLAPYVDACALLGTHLSEAKAKEIIDHKYKNIILSLDADAIDTAIKLQFKWRSKIPNLYILGIKSDIKDMDTQEFEEYLTSVKTFDRIPMEG